MCVFSPLDSPVFRRAPGEALVILRQGRLHGRSGWSPRLFEGLGISPENKDSLTHSRGIRTGSMYPHTCGWFRNPKANHRLDGAKTL